MNMTRTTTTWTTAVIAAVTVGGAIFGTGGAWATGYSDKVQRSCKNDYLSFCSAHPVGSTSMRRCMEANGRQLSKACVNALVDAGEIPRTLRR